MATEPWLARHGSRIFEITRPLGVHFVAATNDTSHRRLLFTCAAGHPMRVDAYKVLDGVWHGTCRTCAQEERKEQLRAQVAARGGRIHGEIPPRTTDYVDLECSAGHRWSARVYSVANDGFWCRECRDARRRITIDDAQGLAQRFGGTVLSESCAGSHDHLTWQCSCSNQWTAPYSVERKKPYFCKSCRIPTGREEPKPTPICETRGRQLARAHEIALERGGLCLSDSYKNLFSTLEFECAVGHRFTLNARSLLHYGSWCRHCNNSGNRRTAIESIQAFAREHGGQLLTAEYRRNDQKLRWRCANGHTFDRTWACMQRGKSFCRCCSSNGSD